MTGAGKAHREGGPRTATPSWPRICAPWMRKLQDDPRIDPTRIGLWGISQGGWIAPLAASREPTTALLVGVSAAGVTPGAQMNFATNALLREAGYGTDVVERVRELRRAMDELARSDVARGSPGSARRQLRRAVVPTRFRAAECRRSRRFLGRRDGIRYSPSAPPATPAGAAVLRRARSLGAGCREHRRVEIRARRRR